MYLFGFIFTVLTLVLGICNESQTNTLQGASVLHMESFEANVMFQGYLIASFFS